MTTSAILVNLSVFIFHSVSHLSRMYQSLAQFLRLACLLSKSSPGALLLSRDDAMLLIEHWYMRPTQTQHCLPTAAQQSQRDDPFVTPWTHAALKDSC